MTFKIQIPKKGTFKFDEHDSTENAWKFYYCRYGNSLINKKFKFKEKEFKVHGEVDFNFGMSKIDDFKYIIKTDPNASDEKKKLAIDLLNICSYFNYSLLNLSIMPSVGNLQGTKASIGKDRFDVFIWALDLYYKGIDLVINSYTSAQNLSELIDILDTFKEQDYHHYFKIIYDIYDEKLISNLIESGQKRIDNTDRVLSYIVLAINVWQTRNNNFDHNQCKTLFYKLGGEKVILTFLPYLDKLRDMGYEIIINN